MSQGQRIAVEHGQKVSPDLIVLLLLLRDSRRRRWPSVGQLQETLLKVQGLAALRMMMIVSLVVQSCTWHTALNGNALNLWCSQGRILRVCCTAAALLTDLRCLCQQYLQLLSLDMEESACLHGADLLECGNDERQVLVDRQDLFRIHVVFVEEEMRDDDEGSLQEAEVGGLLLHTQARSAAGPCSECLPLSLPCVRLTNCLSNRIPFCMPCFMTRMHRTAYCKERDDDRPYLAGSDLLRAM
jgi:hypothetical protein